MDLLLWRHAEAADGRPDLARALTNHGHDQARAMAAWLKKRMPEGIRVLASPARRAQETAAALGMPVETLDELGPDAAPSALMVAARWPDATGAVLIVGHQPTLGETAGAILGAKGYQLAVRKGAVIWLRGQRGSAELVSVTEPEQL